MLITGVHCGACGTKTLRLRPTLLFQKYHADIFLDTFASVLTSMKASWSTHLVIDLNDCVVLEFILDLLLFEINHYSDNVKRV